MVSHIITCIYVYVCTYVCVRTQLGMAVLPNDGKCRMEKSPLGDFYEYTGSRDYVSLCIHVHA